jgi:hypothetical protein
MSTESDPEFQKPPPSSAALSSSTVALTKLRKEFRISKKRCRAEEAAHHHQNDDDTSNDKVKGCGREKTKTCDDRGSGEHDSISTADNLESWPCRWDGETLPYAPAPIAQRHGRSDRVCVYWRHPDSHAIRVCVPDHRGQYHQLIAGIAYYEAPWNVTPVEALPQQATTRHHGAQLDWADLPVPPEEHLLRFVAPSNSTSGEGAIGFDPPPPAKAR